MAVITISRQMASYGDEIAESIAKKTGWALMNRSKVLETFFKPITSKHTYHLLCESAKFFRSAYDKNNTYRTVLENRLHEYIKEHSAVLVGFGSQVILSGHRDVLHIRIQAPKSIRVERVRSQYRVLEPDAERILKTADRRHRRFVSTVFDTNLADPDLYDLILNTADLSVDECTAAILAMQKQHEVRSEINRHLEDQVKSTTDRPDVIHHDNGHPVFKNESESEFARILDMYQIDWVYEPRTFPIEWDAEGNVTLAFSPDFYLPRFDTYIELTTMNQKYVTQKNKKAKRLEELYPGVHIKIVYKRNFQSLVERFRENAQSPGIENTSQQT